MFNNIINKIKINSIQNKKILITKLKKNELNFIKSLIKLNIIKYIFKKKKKYLLILNFWKENKIIFNIKNCLKNSKIRKIKLKNINKLNKKKKLFLLTTNKGLLNNYEASLKKTGGLLLAVIWN